MTCPKCNSTSVYVTDTAHGENNQIYRNRRCSDCDTRFRTVETLIAPSDIYANQAYSKAILNRSKLLKSIHKERNKHV